MKKSFCELVPDYFPRIFEIEDFLSISIAHCVFNSFLSYTIVAVVAISVDRFLAIHLHLRYQELVTHKRVVAAMISTWVLSVFVSFSTFWIPLDIYSLITAFLAVVGLVLTTTANQEYTHTPYLLVRGTDNGQIS